MSRRCLYCGRVAIKKVRGLDGVKRPACDNHIGSAHLGGPCLDPGTAAHKRAVLERR